MRDEYENHTPGTELALPEDGEAAWFKEELVLLRIDKNRIFRTAIFQDTPLAGEMPDIEEQLLEELEIEEAFAELDEARKGQDSVSRELAKWKAELAA